MKTASYENIINVVRFHLKEIKNACASVLLHVNSKTLSHIHSREDNHLFENIAILIHSLHL